MHTDHPFTYLAHPRDDDKVGGNWTLAVVDFGLEGSFSITTDHVHASEHAPGKPEDDVRLWCASPKPLVACKALIAWYEGEVKEYEKAAVERTEWVGVSEFEALLQDGDEDMAINDPALIAVIELARAAIREAGPV